MSRENSQRTEDLSGPAAVRRHQRLASRAEEVVVECEYTGKNRATIRFGRTARYAFVLVLQSGGCDRLLLRPRAEATELFTDWFQFLEEKKAFVNSDPRSPEYFSFKPEEDRLRSLLKKRFGTEVRSMYDG